MSLRAFRRLPAPAPALFGPLAGRQFHSTPIACHIMAGDAIPSVDLHEGSPGSKVNLSAVFRPTSSKGLIIGVPAAFSGTCSQKHVPSYINHPKLADAGDVFVVSVNDAFVMKAWGKKLDPKGKSGIRFLADPTAAFTKALGLGFDAIPIFGHTRSIRYALVIEEGKVKSTHIESDNTGTDASMAEKVLG